MPESVSVPLPDFVRPPPPTPARRLCATAMLKPLQSILAPPALTFAALRVWKKSVRLAVAWSVPPSKLNVPVPPEILVTFLTDSVPPFRLNTPVEL